MTVESHSINEQPKRVITLPGGQSIEVPSIDVYLRFSDVRYEYERHDYTFFQMLGDFGGFIDGLSLIAYALTGWYSKSMF